MNAACKQAAVRLAVNAGCMNTLEKPRLRKEEMEGNGNDGKRERGGKRRRREGKTRHVGNTSGWVWHGSRSQIGVR